MPKGPPDQVPENTVPIYNPDGSIYGWTTPENYVQLSGQFSQGVLGVGGSSIDGGFQGDQYPQGGGPPPEWDDFGDGPWNEGDNWYTSGGDRPEWDNGVDVWGPTDVWDTWYGGDTTAPATPPPGTPPDDGRWNPPPPPWAGGGYPTEPGAPPEWSPPSGVQGVGGTPEVENSFDIDPLNPNNWHGFENSDNKTFYQIQSAAQRASMFRDALREQVARNKANNPPAQEAPSDPWAWAGGADQFKPQVGTGVTPDAEGNVPDYILNPTYDFTKDSTNADIFRVLMSSVPALEQYADRVPSWLEAHPNWDTSTHWANVGNPNTLISNLGADSPLQPANRDMLTTIFQNLYSDTTQPIPGQPYVPAGYAAPINWGGQ